MKAVIIILALFLEVVSPVMSKVPSEKAMKEKMKELTYQGQLERAQDLLGQVSESGKNVSDGKSQKEIQAGGWTATSLMLSLIWGAFGAGYFIYGKKASRVMFLICGIVLCVFPIFVSNDLWSLIIGLAMTILPFKVDF